MPLSSSPFWKGTSSKSCSQQPFQASLSVNVQHVFQHHLLWQNWQVSCAAQLPTEGIKFLRGCALLFPFKIKNWDFGFRNFKSQTYSRNSKLDTRLLIKKENKNKEKLLLLQDLKENKITDIKRKLVWNNGRSVTTQPPQDPGACFGCQNYFVAPSGSRKSQQLKVLFLFLFLKTRHWLFWFRLMQHGVNLLESLTFVMKTTLSLKNVLKRSLTQRLNISTIKLTISTDLNKTSQKRCSTSSCASGLHFWRFTQPVGPFSDLFLIHF